MTKVTEGLPSANLTIKKLYEAANALHELALEACKDASPDDVVFLMLEMRKVEILAHKLDTRVQQRRADSYPVAVS